MKLFLFISLFFAAVFPPGASVMAQEKAANTTPIPNVTIVEPVDASEVPSDKDVIIKFSVQNYVFVDFKNNAEPFPGGPNAGHAHLWLDPPKGQEYNHDTGRKLLSTDPVNLGVLSGGQHTVTMELTQNDHKPYDPPVRASVTFSVGEKAKGLGVLGGGIGGRGGIAAVMLLLFASTAGILWFLRQQKAPKNP